jgi:nucleoside-diphosphate-sugar epimerase
MNDARTMFLLGGTGFIGREAVAQAVAAGWTVKALTRSAEGRQALEAAGAQPIEGAAEEPVRWADSARGAAVLIDLVQPKFPRRLGRRAVQRIAEQRQATTRGVLGAVESVPEGERPLVLAVSGADDLDPGEAGVVSHESPLRSELAGFASIGVPARRLIEASGADAAFVYFGNMVYGGGKVFADVYVEGLKKRRAKVLGSGSNHLPLTHVTDAARALVHIAGLPRAEVVGRTFVASDGSTTTQRELLEYTADLMGAKRPGSVPAGVAALIAGRPAVETLTLDVRADPSALVATGFQFRYPSHREGVPEALARLGEVGERARQDSNL